MCEMMRLAQLIHLGHLVIYFWQKTEAVRKEQHYSNKLLTVLELGTGDGSSHFHFTC